MRIQVPRISMQLSLLARPQSVGTTCAIACCAKPCILLLSCCRQFTYPWNWHWIVQDAKTPIAASVSMALIILHSLWNVDITPDIFWRDKIRDANSPATPEGIGRKLRICDILRDDPRRFELHKEACEASLSSVFSTPRSTFRDLGINNDLWRVTIAKIDDVERCLCAPQDTLRQRQRHRWLAQ